MIRTAHDVHRMRGVPLLSLIVGVAALLACSEQATAPPSTPSLTTTASADRGESGKSLHAAATLEWQKAARDLVIRNKIAPIEAVRLYALHSVAQYAAVVAIGRGADAEDGDHPSTDALRGAIAGASAQLLSSLRSGDKALLEAQLAADGKDASGQTSAEFTRGVSVGRAAGDVMKAWATNDGFSVVWNESMRNDELIPHTWTGALAPLTPPGAKRPPSMGFQFPKMTPYFLKALNGNTAQSQFHPLPPPEYSTVEGSKFQIALKEVSDISADRKDWQIVIANYWNLAASTYTALGHWDEQAAVYIDEHHLSERAASHLYALMNAAVMDATIGCWEAKYSYLMLRPTMANPAITTVYPLPNHPSYPSGHSCVSSAAVTVLERYFPEHSKKLETDLFEAGMSRIYGGIHYRFDIEAGAVLGRATAEWAIDYDRHGGLLAAVGLSEHE